MNSSRQFLLGLLVLGLQAGLVAAQTPGSPTTLPPASGGAGATPLAKGTDFGCENCSYCQDCNASPAPATVLGANDLCPICTACSDRTGIIGGAGIYIIQPYFNNNPAFVLQGTAGRSGSAPGTRADLRVDISHHMGVAPLIWLGYINQDGIGGRARWWTFAQGTSQSTASPTGPAGNSVIAYSAAPLGLSVGPSSAINVTSQMQLQVADLEALNDVRAAGWDLLFAGGLRIARVAQGYNAFISQRNANTLLSSNTFEGVGPTLALEARRPLGGWGLNLYAKARGSVVFGSAHQFVTQPDQNQAAADHRDFGLPIGELELGVEYGRNVGNSRLFGQVALVGQQWFGAGSASRSSVNILPGGGVGPAPVPPSYSVDSDFDFLGLAIRFGVNY